MANTLKFGNGEWYGKKDTILAYNDENSNYKPLPFDFSRASKATVINKDGLIETVGSGEPRIDYKDDSKGALLLEPSRTNYITYSEDFSNAYWTKSDASVTSGFVSPNGTNNAFKLVEGVSNSEHYINGSGTTLTNMSHSIYVKSAGRSQIKLFDSSRGHYAWFNLDDGTIGSSTATSSSITPMYNGWYRITISKNSTGFSQFRLYLGVAESDSYIGNGTSGVYIYGAQLEQGSYATSYIPTQGSTVTRLADVCNNGANEQVINSTEGVLYYEGSALANDGTTRIISLSDNTTSNRVLIKYDNIDNRLEFFVIVGGVAQYSFIDVVDDLLNYNKIAFKYKENDFAVWVNGIELDSNVSGNTLSANTLTTLKFQASNSASDFYGNVKEVKLYNTALTDIELQALTT